MKGLILTGKVRHVLEMLSVITNMMLETKGSDKLEDMTCDDLKTLFDEIEMAGNYTWNEEEKQMVANLLATD